jgi:hypothetical protein
VTVTLSGSDVVDWDATTSAGLAVRDTFCAAVQAAVEVVDSTCTVLRVLAASVQVDFAIFYPTTSGMLANNQDPPTTMHKDAQRRVDCRHRYRHPRRRLCLLLWRLDVSCWQAS